MFLLLLFSDFFLILQQSIYIPLCFYYYKIILEQKSQSRYIYIPLCFYYYSNRRIRRCDCCLFTFHYVSITTTNCSVVAVYCSFIYIPLCFYYYTFYLFHFSQISLFTFHYVSITTYTTINIAVLNPSFTFHYVSITTISCYVFPTYLYVFTFHYVSITTVHGLNLSGLCISIYIPLCFYYYVNTGFAQASQCHLHSTMFLLLQHFIY